MTVPYEPGDCVLFHGTDLEDRAIEFGEFLRPPFPRRKRDATGRRSWWWSHAGLIVVTGLTAATTATIEARSDGVVRATIGTRKHTVISCPEDVNRDRAVRYARSVLGEAYDWGDDFDIGVDMLFGTRWHSDSSGALICSELVARAWVAGGWDAPQDPALITPADLDAYAEAGLLERIGG